MCRAPDFRCCYSSPCTKHFSLPYHTPTFSRIYPLGGQCRHVWQIDRQPPCHHYPPTNNSSTSSHKIRSFVSVSHPSAPTKLGLLSLPLLPPIGFQQNIPMVVHSTPIEVSHLQQIHTQALAKNQSHPQQFAHVLQLYRSHILNPSHSTRVSWHNLVIPLSHRLYRPISWQ